mmetsp:Transcript_90206/g.263803  ORF Transcript_90206/g.263803 Transcript_90206/m.263803 type:complete len:253 (+) Transcript_90206:1304-2062(+)
MVKPLPAGLTCPPQGGSWCAASVRGIFEVGSGNMCPQLLHHSALASCTEGHAGGLRRSVVSQTLPLLRRGGRNAEAREQLPDRLIGGEAHGDVTAWPIPERDELAWGCSSSLHKAIGCKECLCTGFALIPDPQLCTLLDVPHHPSNNTPATGLHVPLELGLRAMIEHVCKGQDDQLPGVTVRVGRGNVHCARVHQRKRCNKVALCWTSTHELTVGFLTGFLAMRQKRCIGRCQLFAFCLDAMLRCSPLELPC